MRGQHVRGIACSAWYRPLIALITIAFWCFAFLAVAPAWAEAPPAPTGLTATMASSKQINLAWTDNDTTETKLLCRAFIKSDHGQEHIMRGLI